jgi:hypothetical protein
MWNPKSNPSFLTLSGDELRREVLKSLVLKSYLTKFHVENYLLGQVEGAQQVYDNVLNKGEQVRLITLPLLDNDLIHPPMQPTNDEIADLMLSAVKHHSKEFERINKELQKAQDQGQNVSFSHELPSTPLTTIPGPIKSMASVDSKLYSVA